MRRVLLLVLIVVGLVGLGVSRGWFHFSSESHDTKENITVTVDQDKIRQDKDKAVATVENLGHQAKDKVTVTTQKAEH